MNLKGHKIINYNRKSFDILKVKSIGLSPEPKHIQSISSVTLELQKRKEYIYNPKDQEYELIEIEDIIEFEYKKWEDANIAFAELERIWTDNLKEL